ASAGAVWWKAQALSGQGQAASRAATVAALVTEPAVSGFLAVAAWTVAGQIFPATAQPANWGPPAAAVPGGPLFPWGLAVLSWVLWTAFYAHASLCASCWSLIS